MDEAKEQMKTTEAIEDLARLIFDIQKDKIELAAKMCANIANVYKLTNVKELAKKFGIKIITKRQAQKKCPKLTEFKIDDCIAIVRGRTMKMIVVNEDGSEREKELWIAEMIGYYFMQWNENEIRLEEEIKKFQAVYCKIKEEKLQTFANFLISMLND